MFVYTLKLEPYISTQRHTCRSRCAYRVGNRVEYRQKVFVCVCVCLYTCVCVCVCMHVFEPAEADVRTGWKIG